MPYETGTATDHTDLFNVKLKAFCQANGWTVNNDGYPTWLAMSKGDCYINIRKDSSTTTSMTTRTTQGTASGNDPFGVARTDTRIWYFVSGGYTATTWEGQAEGSVDSTSTNEPFGLINDMTGPFVAYHFYSSDPGAPANFICMCVETIDDHYQHFMFGEVDNGILTYSPKASFAMGQYYIWWPISTNYSFRDDLESYGGNHEWMFQGVNVNSYNLQIHPGGALTVPNGNAYPGRNTGAVNESIDIMLMYENEVINRRNEPAGVWNDTGASSGTLYSGYENRPPIAYSGVSLLIPHPIIVGNGGETPTATHWLGQLPGIRYVSMDGVVPGQEIQYGPDTWQCWPQRRKTGQSKIPEVEVPASPGIANNSHYHGIAYKKTT